MKPAAAPLARSCSTPRRSLLPPAPLPLLGCCALLTCTAALARRALGVANARKQAPVAVQLKAMGNLPCGHWKRRNATGERSVLPTMTDSRNDQRPESMKAPC